MTESHASASAPAGRWGRVKKRLKSSKLLYRVLRFPYALVKAVWKFPQTVVHELRHVGGTYRLAKTFDLILVSGGGQIDDYWGGAWGHPFTLFKWGLLAKGSRTPLIFLSVGVCTLESRLSEFFVRGALKAASLRSYRDEKSKKLLQGFPFTQSDAVFPDLAFSYPRARHKTAVNTRNDKTSITVGVSPIAYLSGFDWPRRDLAIFERYMEQLTAFTVRLLRAGNSVVLFATDAPDRKAVSHLFVRLENLREETGWGDVRQVDTLSVDALFSELVQMDYVIASRLHGIILSHLVSLPALALSYDRKVDTYMEEAGQERYCFDIHSVTAEDIEEGFRSMSEKRSDVIRELASKVAANEAKLGGLYDRLVELVPRNGTSPAQGEFVEER